jgi:hypothetical protein
MILEHVSFKDVWMAANLISIFDAMQKFFERQVDIIE